MGLFLKFWPLLAFPILHHLSTVTSASVSARENQEPVTNAEVAPEPPLEEDDEASVQDEPQHFFYRGSQTRTKENEEEESNHEDEDLDGVDDWDLDPDPSMEDVLMGMADDHLSRDAKSLNLEQNTISQYHAPFTGSEIGLSLPGSRAPFTSRLIPINLPVRQELVQKIIGNDPYKPIDGDCPCRSEDFGIPDGFVFDPTVAYHESHRSKRSAGYGDDDYWYKLNDPSKHLEKHDVYYRIQNDLRHRVEEDSYPLHYGHIYTGNIGHHGDYNIHDRAFGPDADFNFPYDIHAFKWKPHGPRLNKKWAKYKYPIFSHNLYKLREHILAMEFGKGGAGKKVKLHGGVYKFVSVTKKGDLLLTNVKTHQRFLIPRLFARPYESKKFQALGPWIDPNGLYFPVSAPVLGDDAYIIKGTPLTGNDPKKGNDLVYDGIHDIHPASPSSLLNREKGKKHPKDFKPPHKPFKKH